MAGPCNWQVSYAACAGCTTLNGMSVEDKAMVEDMATEFLWNWTLKAFGVCDVVVRPCRQDCSQLSTFWGNGPYGHGSLGGGPWPNPQLVGGAWTNVSCGFCPQDDCSCSGSRLMTLKLPGPISSVSEVTIDGAVLLAANYRVDNHSLLVRLDGLPWPRCQDMSLPPSEAGTFQISYERGRQVPVGGQTAAGLLACEMAKALCRDASCALPARLQSITRQGVTMAVLDDFKDVSEGRTGIWLIDSWVASIVKPPARSQVFSVDVPRPKYRTTGG